MPKARASPHPSLLSQIKYTGFFLPVCLFIIGRHSTVCLSTENPTPVPHIDIYIISAKSCQLAGAIKEQLYTQTLLALAGAPALQSKRIDPIAFISSMYSRISEYSARVSFLPRFSFINEM